MDHRDPLEQRGVVHEVTGGEVVRPVHDRVVAVDDVEDVVGAQPHVVGDDVHVRVERGQRLLRRVDLAVAHPVHVVQDLALQVRLVDDVHVDDAERADPGCRQVEGGRRAEAAGAEQQHLGPEQLQLADLAHLGQEEMALVPVALRRSQGLGGGPRAAVVLPAVEPADQRLHVGVALQASGSENTTWPGQPRAYSVYLPPVSTYSAAWCSCSASSFFTLPQYRSSRAPVRPSR